MIGQVHWVLSHRQLTSRQEKTGTQAPLTHCPAEKKIRIERQAKASRTLLNIKLQRAETSEIKSTFKITNSQNNSLRIKNKQSRSSIACNPQFEAKRDRRMWIQMIIKICSSNKRACRKVVDRLRWRSMMRSSSANITRAPTPRMKARTREESNRSNKGVVAFWNRRKAKRRKMLKLVTSTAIDKVNRKVSISNRTGMKLILIA